MGLYKQAIMNFFWKKFINLALFCCEAFSWRDLNVLFSNYNLPSGIKTSFYIANKLWFLMPRNDSKNLWVNPNKVEKFWQVNIL